MRPLSFFQRMKTHMVGLLAMGLILAVGVETVSAQQSKTFNNTVPLASGGGLTLKAMKGSVRLTAWDREEVEIHARIEVDSSFPEYARRALELTTVEVVGAGRQVMIRSNSDAVPSQIWFFGITHTTPSIHYEIRAPRKVDLQLDIDRSPTTIIGFEGKMVLELDRSELQAENLAGDVRVNIGRGGDSSFRNIRGSINLTANRTNVRVELLSLNASSRIEIARGDADVSVARGQGFDLTTALTRRADFKADVALQFRSGDRRNLRASINGGGPRLSIDADRGSVRLRS